MKLHNLVVIFVFILLVACSNSNDSGRGIKPVYVKPSVDYKGKYRKGHLRMPVSTKKDAMKSQIVQGIITKLEVNTGVKNNRLIKLLLRQKFKFSWIQAAN